jgi:hypothetical protein
MALVNNSTEHIFFSEADYRSVGQELPPSVESQASLLCWQAPTTEPHSSYMNPVNTLILISVRAILIVSSYLHVYLL